MSDTYVYKAFGNLEAHNGISENKYLFTGEQFDDGLAQYYLRVRYYDPAIGRFTQMDTFAGVNRDPITLHKYLYANASPVNFTDPSGNFSFAEFSAASDIRGILATAAIQTPRLGFSFLQNATGQIVGVAATTCVASLVATHFGIIEPIAQFSKKCDGSVHRGRWQAQGGGLEESEPWSRPSPLTLNQGLALLDTLEAKLRRPDRRARAPYFEQARLFARRLSIVGVAVRIVVV